MARRRYAIGVDFGPEWGRALLVDVANGQEVATEIHPYANGVIDEHLPGTNIRLEPDWALQDPNDYLEVFRHAIPSVLEQSGVDPTVVIGVGIDFTSCTMLPTKADGPGEVRGRMSGKRCFAGCHRTERDRPIRRAIRTCSSS